MYFSRSNGSDKDTFDNVNHNIATDTHLENASITTSSSLSYYKKCDLQQVNKSQKLTELPQGQKVIPGRWLYNEKGVSWNWRRESGIGTLLSCLGWQKGEENDEIGAKPALPPSPPATWMRVLEYKPVATLWLVSMAALAISVWSFTAYLGGKGDSHFSFSFHHHLKNNWSINQTNGWAIILLPPWPFY